MALEDALGNLVSSNTSNVTVALGAGSPSATLHGTLTVAASGGIATFNTLTIGKIANGYTLTATDTGLVVILDPRVLTKGYGRSFLAALPECRRFVDGAPE